MNQYHEEEYETPKGTLGVHGTPGAFRMTHQGQTANIPTRFFDHAVAAAHAAAGVPVPAAQKHWLEKHDTLPPDWSRHGYPLQPSEKGLNEAWVWGNRFIKSVYSPSHLTEPAVSRMFKATGASHLPVSYAHRDGMHLLHSEYEPGLKNLNAADGKDLESIDSDKAQHILLTEWLAGVDDRHGGNYAFHPRHGLVSLDHEYALGHNGGGVPHVDVTRSALWSVLRRHKGLTPSTPIPEKALAAVKRVGDELVQHAAVGGGQKAATAVSDRLRALGSLTAPTWGDVVDWTDKANGRPETVSKMIRGAAG